MGGRGPGDAAADYNDVSVQIHWICLLRFGTASSLALEG